MNQNYFYFLSDWQKVHFLVCHRILVVYVCHEMRRVESPCPRPSPLSGYMERHVTDKGVLVERASLESLLSEYWVLSLPCTLGDSDPCLQAAVWRSLWLWSYSAALGVAHIPQSVTEERSL